MFQTSSKIVVDIGPKALSFGDFVTFSRVHYSESIPFEVLFSKDRLNEIRRMDAFTNKLPFETTDGL